MIRMDEHLLPDIPIPSFVFFYSRGRTRTFRQSAAPSAVGCVSTPMINAVNKAGKQLPGELIN